MGEWIANAALHLYSITAPISGFVLAVVVLVLLPLSIWRRMRGGAGAWIFGASYVFGLVAWLLGCGATWSGYGWIGLILGLVVVGIGVVPLAILAAFFKDTVPIGVAWELFTLIGLTWGCRIVGAMLMASANTLRERDSSPT